MAAFRDRLRKAIQAGADAQQQRAADQRLAQQQEQKLRALYDRYERGLRDHIEACLNELVDQWPGFDLTSVVSDKGWGHAVSRDDRVHGRQDRLYNRLELTVRSYADYQFIEVLAKGTIRNREVIRRSDDDRMETADLALLKKFIERIVVEFARRYAEGRSPQG
jgi:hypothetical protein